MQHDDGAGADDDSGDAGPRSAHASGASSDGARSQVLARPYAERRVVVIAPDEDLASRGASSTSSAIDWKKLVALGVVPAAGALAAPMLVSAAGLAWALDRDRTRTHALARRVAREAGRVLPSLREGVRRAAYRVLSSATGAASPPGAVATAEPDREAPRSSPQPHAAPLSTGTLIVPLAMASRELAFPPAHPQLDQAYAAHPLEAGRYLPIAIFHRTLFEQKCGELLTLVAALGARRVRAVCKQGYRSLHTAGVRVDAPVEAIAAREGLSRTRDAVHSLVFEEHYEPDVDRAPAVPEGLVWFAHEPSWQALARRRIEFGVRELRAQLTYTDDFGVNAELALGLEALGVRGGLTAREFEATVWELEVEFA